MSTISKRIKHLLTPGSEQKQTKEDPINISICASERRLRQLQSDLLLDSSLIENPAKVSLKDHINARIAQSETTESTAKPKRTIINLDSLVASIYFWSPFASRNKKEERKLKFITGKTQGQIGTVNTGSINKSTHRNKDAFVNFSEPALIMVAKNSETPTSTLKWLAAHHSAEVRQSVARNINTDDETLELLSDDPDDNVKIALLDSARIGKNLTAKLARDRNLCLSAKAQHIYYQLDSKQKEPCHVSKQKDSEEQIIQSKIDFLKTAADSDTTDAAIICKSTPPSDWHIRMLVAGDPKATTEILWQLATHPISKVKRKAVDKYKCSLLTDLNLHGEKTVDVPKNLAVTH